MRFPVPHTFQSGIIVASLALLPVIGWSGCHAAPRPPPLPEKLVVFFSNDTQSELFPGGKHNPMGGISRRATILASKPDIPRLIVDTGNFSTRRPNSDYSKFKTAWYLRIYDHVGYAALNAGRFELQGGAAVLRELATQAGEKLISANILDGQGHPVLPAFRIVEVAGLKIGLIGLISPTFTPDIGAAPDPLTITDPLVALGAVLPSVVEQSDLQVVLSQLKSEELEALTQQFPEVDLILGGPDWDSVTEREPWSLHDVPLARVGMYGKYQGEIDLTLDVTEPEHIALVSYEGTVHGLGSAVADNPEVETSLEEFRARLRKGEVIQDIYEPRSAAQQYGYAGSIYCADCHRQIYEGTLNTRHAQAFQTLAAVGEKNNPGCLECHTVGFDEPWGYLEKKSSYLLASVQCESCHGAASDHMVVASQFYKQGRRNPESIDWKIAIPNPQADTCVKCHNEENDPHYADGVWPYQAMVDQITCSQWLHPVEE